METKALVPVVVAVIFIKIILVLIKIILVFVPTPADPSIVGWRFPRR